jgi:hypothetical protein
MSPFGFGSKARDSGGRGRSPQKQKIAIVYVLRLKELGNCAPYLQITEGLQVLCSQQICKRCR